jgi:hypothetical protein
VREDGPIYQLHEISEIKHSDEPVRANLINKMAGVFQLGFDSDNVSDDIESKQDQEEQKVSIANRLAAGFGGVFGQSPDRPDQDESDDLNITPEEASFQEKSGWVNSKVEKGQMDKVGRSTWARIAPEAKQKLALPSKHVMINEEEDEGENQLE